MTLGPPPRSLQHTALPTVIIAAAKLFRISRHSTGEPHFGRSGANRFDDPNRVVSKRYGTCYCGLGLDTAIAETVLHDEVAVKNQFNIASSEILSRYLVRFRGEDLELADMTGSRLKFMGGEGSLSTVIPYTLTQHWSRAVHSHPRGVDGMYYMSRVSAQQTHLEWMLSVLQDRVHANPSCTPCSKPQRFQDIRYPAPTAPTRHSSKPNW